MSRKDVVTLSFFGFLCKILRLSFGPFDAYLFRCDFLDLQSSLWSVKNWRTKVASSGASSLPCWTSLKHCKSHHRKNQRLSRFSHMHLRTLCQVELEIENSSFWRGSQTSLSSKGKRIYMIYIRLAISWRCFVQSSGVQFFMSSLTISGLTCIFVSTMVGSPTWLTSLRLP